MIARRHAIPPARDFAFLQALGADLSGAVVIAGAPGSEEPTQPESDLEGPLEQPLRFSLAGMQLKFSASVAGKRVTVPLAGLGGSWIVKLPTNAYPRLPENERAVMEFARIPGFDVPRTDLVELDRIAGLPTDLPSLLRDEPRVAYLIQRFDRPTPEKSVHFEDLNQVANQKPAQKYERRTMDWVGNVIATLCPAQDVDEFVRRVVFGVCVGNGDMHLKNWAVTYPDGRSARIAPLYDFVCTRQYFPNGELALSVGGCREFGRMDFDAIATFACAAEISARRAAGLARETADAMRATWGPYRATIDNAGLVRAIVRQLDVVPLTNGQARRVF